jgi:hypothetical protein
MIPIVITSALIGSLTTWVATKYFYAGKRRRCVREATGQNVRSMEIQDQLYATYAMLYLSALRALESGDSESAKRDLASGAAGFYYQFRGAEQSQWIRARKREVELLAKTSRVLRESMEKRKNDLAA